THDLTKVYGDGAEVRALDGVNLTMRRGEMVAVMGPSGSGKSTLLNMLGALDRPTSGRVLVNDQDLATIKNVDRFRAQTVGFVFQFYNLLPTLTARENIEVPMQGQPISRGQRRQRAEELLHLVGLGERMHHQPAQLSGGERQRVAIARALANEPAILLADEPTGNLDSQSGMEVMDLLQEINRQRDMTMLLVTHDPRVARTAQRILTMHDGCIVDDHTVGDPLSEDLREMARSLLGQLLQEGKAEHLAAVGLSDDGRLTPAAQTLAELLAAWA
nr:ABC transporter ATP-binding protein [Chloroflexota bacterium]